MILDFLIAVVVVLDAILFAYLLYEHLSRRNLRMLTQDEQAIIDVVRGLVTKVESSDAAIAAAQQATVEAQNALAAEKADHAELVSSLQTVITGAA